MVLRWMLLLVPFSLALRYALHVSPLIVFLAAIAAIIPLAEWIRRSTERLASALGPEIGGLLNVTFGNVAELLIAVFVLLDGKPDVVKGQITGSIIGNGLLGLGLAVVVGSFRRDKQTFNRQSAGRLTSLLILSVIALLIPALFDYTERDIVHASQAGRLDEKLSLYVSVVLILVYLANLIYTLVTHRDMFEAAGSEAEEREARRRESGTAAQARGTIPLAGGILLGATALIAWEAELIAGSLTAASRGLHVSEFFLGVVVLAVIGNAAEYVAACYFARKDRMTIVMGITVGSSIQVALFVAPALVLLSVLIGRPMDLVFANPLELIAVAAVAFAVDTIALDGETTWFEGVLLIAVYALLALAFFFVAP